MISILVCGLITVFGIIIVTYVGLSIISFHKKEEERGRIMREELRKSGLDKFLKITKTDGL